MRFRAAVLVLALLSACAEPGVDTQPAGALPDLLTFENGGTVVDAEAWRNARRAEILELFETHVYGRSPVRPAVVHFEELTPEVEAFGGRATRKEVRVYLGPTPEGPAMDLLIYAPQPRPARVPAFLTLNFFGNHSIHPDPDITLSRKWMRANADFGVVDNRATRASRGVRSRRWDVESIVKRGYALATIYYGDIDPDFDDDFQNGVHPVFDESRGPESWGSIAAWAWGLSRAMDYLEEDGTIDAGRVAVMGHSRLGKASLWAGAQDERFALVISNESGCGGAALSRRRFGETVKDINDRFPHWFCENFRRYNDNEDSLPIDQHMLVALMAPRPVYVASAIEDNWADPEGEFLSAMHAGAVYELFGKEAIQETEMPAVEQPIMTTVGYHVRTGGHDVTPYDWARFIEFADKHLK